MALTFSEDFELGTDAAPLSGLTGFNGHNNPGGNTFTSDSALGSLGMRAKTTSGTAATYSRVTLPTGRDFYIRMYVKLVLTPSAGFTLSQVVSGSTVRAALRVNPNGSLQRRSGSANVGAVTTAGLLSTTEWARVEWGITSSTQQLRVFKGTNLHGTAPTYDSGTTSWSFTTSANATWFGSALSGLGIEVLIDEIAIDDTTWPAPPIVTPPSPWRVITPTGPVVAIARVRTGSGWSPAP